MSDKTIKFKKATRFSEPAGKYKLTGINVLKKFRKVYIIPLTTRGDHHYRWLELTPKDAVALAKLLVPLKKKKP